MTEPAIDPAAFDRLVEITGGDLEFVGELIDTYVDDADGQLAALRTAAAADDAAAMLRPSHTLKSSSANVGATLVADLCRSIEADARAGAVPDAVARVEAVADALAAATADLSARRMTG
jgi:HPt (histidine-containing phosphotransfer) domain-containing protein